MHNTFTTEDTAKESAFPTPKRPRTDYILHIAADNNNLAIAFNKLSHKPSGLLTPTLNTSYTD